MPRFKIDTTKSNFDPIEIEIDGEVYEIVRVTSDVLDELSKHERKAKLGDVPSLSNQLAILTGGKLTIDRCKNLDIREIREALTFITDNLISPTKFEDKEKKKVERPGGHDSEK